MRGTVGLVQVTAGTVSHTVVVPGSARAGTVPTHQELTHLDSLVFRMDCLTLYAPQGSLLMPARRTLPPPPPQARHTPR